MRDLGLPVYPELIVDGHFSPYVGYCAMRAILLDPNIRKPDAVVCADDETAMGCLNAYQDLGYSVPRDVSVTGFSSPQGASSCETAITSPHYSMQELAATAIGSLLNMLSGKSDGSIKYIDPQLVMGSTTQPRRPEFTL